jgi:DNA-binding beta-propeller fold protein YncE
MRRHLRRLAPVLAVVSVLGLQQAPSAAAISKNVFAGAFSGSGDHALVDPSAVAVDQQSHDLYVTDPAHHRVERFSPSGQFILMFGKGVDATTGGDICTAASGDECQAGSAGSEPGELVDPAFLAVDGSGGPSSGDVYVGDRVSGGETGDVQKFDSSGHLVTGWAQDGLLDGSSDPSGRTFRGVGDGEGLTGIAVDPTGNLFVIAQGAYFEFGQDGSFVRQFEGSDEEVSIVVDAEDNISFINRCFAFKCDPGWIRKRTAEGSLFAGNVVKEEKPPFDFVDLGIDTASQDLFLTLKSGKVRHFLGSCDFLHETCTPFDTFGEGHLTSPRGVAIDEATGTVYVADAGAGQVAVFSAMPFLPDLTASAHGLSPTAESLEGTVDPAGAGEITSCRFQYVTDAAFAATGYADLSSGGEATCAEGQSFSAPAQIHASVEGLTYGTGYHFRLVAENSNGVAATYDHRFESLPKPPIIGPESVASVHSGSALVRSQVTPGGGESVYHTTYQVEYITQAEFEANEEDGEDGFTGAASSPTRDAGSSRTPQDVQVPLAELTPGTSYRYRLVARNASGTTVGPARGFTTLPFGPLPPDGCANSHVRQQTGAALLLDCRAYELVSAADTAGYDVESNLALGQAPFGGYPEADGRVLYGIHGGGIPGTGEPTDRGGDPYLATRGESGWTTTYVGVPAGDPYSEAPFSSPLLGADAGLTTFAFGGAGLCSPCFEDGSSGIPVRLPDGRLVQGMAGPIPDPEARPDGYVAKSLSADGEHLVFSTISQVAPGGNEESGDVSIYDRNLSTGSTAVVSNTPEGEDFPEPLACLQGAGKCDAAHHDANGISALDMSRDGSRIVVAQKVSEDTDHNAYWHLYMAIGDGVRSVDLTPGVISRPGGLGFAEGVLYDGMSADGSSVFFTTRDGLLAEDTDSSADIYEARVGGSGEVSLRLVSTGPEEPSNSNACNPVADKDGPHWNTVGSEANCGAVAIGGGGGVAAGGGAIYFLSPEKLAGSEGGSLNVPNLYLDRPGEAPRFVTSLSANDSTVRDAVKEASSRRTSDFEVTSTGGFAAFPSFLQFLPEEESSGHIEVYRYAIAGETLSCASCAFTGAHAEGDAQLAENGLSLVDDGRLFFDSPEQLAATDTDGRIDTYEWAPPGTGSCTASTPTFNRLTDACLALISAGTSVFDSRLLSASSSGRDAYFFTRDSLIPQDHNGATAKIYDAREGGGFPFTPSAVPCQASDECHGAATEPAPPKQVGSLGGTEGNVSTGPAPCRKGRVRRHGTCVRKPHPRKRHGRHRHRRHH